MKSAIAACDPENVSALRRSALVISTIYSPCAGPPSDDTTAGATTSEAGAFG